MPNIAVTNTFTNGTAADATQVNTNFTDIINGTSDGTKDFSISALTVGGTATLNGNVNLGNSSADDLSITASLASSIPVKTTGTYNIGSATLGILSAYFGNASNSNTVRLLGGVTTSSYTMTLPTAAPSAGQVVAASSSSALAFSWGIAPRSVTTTDTATVADSTLNLSGASFTQNLFTAVGNSGKRLTIRHAGTSYSQVYTIDPNSTETINGAATFKLTNFGEFVTIESDGTNWNIISRYVPSVWESCTFTMSWVSNATITAFRRRRGDSLDFNVQVATSGLPTATGLILTMPTDSTIDTAKLPNSTEYENRVGSLIVYDASGAVDQEDLQGIVTVASSTTLRTMCIDNAAASDHWLIRIQESNAPITFASGDRISMNFTLPIVGLEA